MKKRISLSLNKKRIASLKNPTKILGGTGGDAVSAKCVQSDLCENTLRTLPQSHPKRCRMESANCVVKK